MFLQELKKDEHITYDSDWDEIIVKTPSPKNEEIVIDLANSD